MMSDYKEHAFFLSQIGTRLSGRKTCVLIEPTMIRGVYGACERHKEWAVVTIKPEYAYSLYLFLHEVAHAKLHFDDLKRYVRRQKERTINYSKLLPSTLARIEKHEKEAWSQADKWLAWADLNRDRSKPELTGQLIALANYEETA